MNILRHILAILIACAGLLGQTAPKAAPAPATDGPTAAPTSITIGEESYPFPLQERDKVRDQQHEYDQIEIENQKMLVKIEQNKARQAALLDEIRLGAFQFAQTRKSISISTNSIQPRSAS